jgi:hypothetical protein
MIASYVKRFTKERKEREDEEKIVWSIISYFSCGID